MKIDLGQKMSEVAKPSEESGKFYPTITVRSPDSNYKAGDTFTATFEVKVKNERIDDNGESECTLELRSMSDIEPGDPTKEEETPEEDSTETGSDEENELSDISVKGAEDSGEAADMYMDQMKKKKAKKEAIKEE